MPTQLELESLFAAVGLEPILRGAPSLHKYQVRQAAALPVEIRRRMSRFMATDAFLPAAEMPPFDFEAVQDVIAAGQTPEQAAALYATVPDRDLADDLGVQANRILTWADGARPKPDLAAARPEDPDPSATSDFRRAWQVACDPLTVLADLEDGSLSDDQVGTLALLYPAIYAEMRQAVSDARAQLKARRGMKWEPAPKKAALLDVLLEQNPPDLELAGVVQGIYANEAAQQQQPVPPSTRRKRASDDALTAATPGQAATAG